MKELFLYIVNSTVALFVIVDPFAVIPVYLSLTDRFDLTERRHIRKKSVVIACLVLLLFSLSGLLIFRFFGISMPAFRIAGGILLLMFGIEQLAAKRNRVKKEEEEEGLEKDDISIFPLATPLLAGPGAISTIVLYAGQAPSISFRLGLAVSVVAVMISAYAILATAPYLFKVLGKTGLNLLTRVMGIILTAIAIEFIIVGLREAFL